MKADQVLQDKVRSLKNVDIIFECANDRSEGDAGSKVVGWSIVTVSAAIFIASLAGIFCADWSVAEYPLAGRRAGA